MEVRLSKKVFSKNLNKVVDCHKWLNKVKHCGKGLHAERAEYERIAKENKMLYVATPANAPPVASPMATIT